MSEREREHQEGQGSGEFRDTEVHNEEELHASFADLDKPAPDTDPFADQDEGGREAGGDSDDDSEDDDA